MSFKKYVNDYNKVYRDHVLESARKQMSNGMIEVKNKDMSIGVWDSWDEKTLHLYNALIELKKQQKCLYGLHGF